MSFEFKCTTCGDVHKRMPSFGFDQPLGYFEVPEEQSDARCELGGDDCVIDAKWFFIRGCIEIPLHGEDEPFSWGVWVSVSKGSFDSWTAFFHQAERSHIGPFFGWLNASLKPYPDTLKLKTKVHLRDEGIRPYIEIEPTHHPLAVEQREDISVEWLISTR